MTENPVLVSRTTPAPYIMGRTDRERNRLLLQGSILNPLTEHLLRKAGISAGMRVLDLGCGIGDVASIAARLVGPNGQVIGIDVDSQALELARERASDANSRHLTFERADFTEYHPDKSFDAVVARHVLLHTADPLSVMRKAASFLRPGGIAALEEYDLSFWPAGYPETPLASGLQQAMVQLFRAVTPHPNIGMRLCHLMQKAGFSTVRSSAECLMDGGPDSMFYQWFAETVQSVLPVMEKLGLAALARDAASLAERLRDEILAARSCLTSPLIVHAFGRKT